MVKSYCRQVGNISDTTYNNALTRGANKVEAALGLSGSEIPDTYYYLNSVKDIVEMFAACRIHMKFGDPADAEFYCSEWRSGLEELKLNDSSLDTGGQGYVKSGKLVTSPSNPLSLNRLRGRRGIPFTAQLPDWEQG